MCPLTLAQRKKQASWIRKSAGLVTTRAGFRFQLCFIWPWASLLPNTSWALPLSPSPPAPLRADSCHLSYDIWSCRPLALPLSTLASSHVVSPQQPKRVFIKQISSFHSTDQNSSLLLLVLRDNVPVPNRAHETFTICSLTWSPPSFMAHCSGHSGLWAPHLSKPLFASEPLLMFFLLFLPSLHLIASG